MSRREREIVRRISVLERDPQGAKLQDAEDTINKFFEAYPQGAKWIDRTHESGRENFFAPNLFGGRRHLYGYISASYGVHSAMDRRGPNSLIQGPLSQVGYVAVYHLEQWLDELSTETNLPLIKNIGVFNMVHDSQELEAPILLLPLASYMLEHACTTMIVDYFRKFNTSGKAGYQLQARNLNHEPLGIPLNVEFEVDQEIGANLGETNKYDGHRRSMLSSMEPLARTKRERRQLRENIDIIMSIREKELKKDLKSYAASEEAGIARKPSNRRLLTAKDVLRMHLPEEVQPKARHRL
jgi:hypothetical protein